MGSEFEADLSYLASTSGHKHGRVPRLTLTTSGYEHIPMQRPFPSGPRPGTGSPHGTRSHHLNFPSLYLSGQLPLFASASHRASAPHILTETPVPSRPKVVALSGPSPSPWRLPHRLELAPPKARLYDPRQDLLAIQAMSAPLPSLRPITHQSLSRGGSNEDIRTLSRECVFEAAKGSSSVFGMAVVRDGRSRVCFCFGLSLMASWEGREDNMPRGCMVMVVWVTTHTSATSAWTDALRRIPCDVAVRAMAASRECCFVGVAGSVLPALATDVLATLGRQSERRDEDNPGHLFSVWTAEIRAPMTNETSWVVLTRF